MADILGDKLIATVGNVPALMGYIGDLVPGDIFNVPFEGSFLEIRIVRDNGMPNTPQYLGWSPDARLIMQEHISTGSVWVSNDYATGGHDAHLGTTYMNSFPLWFQDLLLEGTIPVTVGNTAQVELITRKIFTPSLAELGATTPNAVPIGTAFNPAMFPNNASRVALILDSLQPNFYSSRNPNTSLVTTIQGITTVGGVATATLSALNSGRMRPCMCIPPTAKFTIIDGRRILVP